MCTVVNQHVNSYRKAVSGSTSGTLPEEVWDGEWGMSLTDTVSVGDSSGWRTAAIGGELTEVSELTLSPLITLDMFEDMYVTGFVKTPMTTAMG